MRRFAAALPLLAVACGSGSPSPTALPTATSAAVATPVAPVSRQIGSRSSLTASTSALSGEVSDFAVERTATETRVALAADTLFAFDRADLTPAAQANLSRTADVVRAGADGTVQVIGYTDDKGDDAYNLDLSQRRAIAVSNWLAAQSGLGDRQIDAVGRGEAEPLAPNAKPDGGDDPDGRARNRRVVVVVPR